MRTLLRILVTFVSGVAAFYVVYWVGGALIFSAGLSWWIPFLASILAAIVVARYVWMHTDSFQTGFARSVLLGAVVTGGIAFSAGFTGSHEGAEPAERSMTVLPNIRAQRTRGLASLGALNSFALLALICAAR